MATTVDFRELPLLSGLKMDEWSKPATTLSKLLYDDQKLSRLLVEVDELDELEAEVGGGPEVEAAEEDQFFSMTGATSIAAVPIEPLKPSKTKTIDQKYSVNPLENEVAFYTSRRVKVRNFKTKLSNQFGTEFVRIHKTGLKDATDMLYMWPMNASFVTGLPGKDFVQLQDRFLNSVESCEKRLSSSSNSDAEGAGLDLINAVQHALLSMVESRELNHIMPTYNMLLPLSGTFHMCDPTLTTYVVLKYLKKDYLKELSLWHTQEHVPVLKFKDWTWYRGQPAAEDKLSTLTQVDAVAMWPDEWFEQDLHGAVVAEDGSLYHRGGTFLFPNPAIVPPLYQAENVFRRLHSIAVTQEPTSVTPLSPLIDHNTLFERMVALAKRDARFADSSAADWHMALLVFVNRFAQANWYNPDLQSVFEPLSKRKRAKDAKDAADSGSHLLVRKLTDDEDHFTELDWHQWVYILLTDVYRLKPEQLNVFASSNAVTRIGPVVFNESKNIWWFAWLLPEPKEKRKDDNGKAEDYLLMEASQSAVEK